MKLLAAIDYQVDFITGTLGFIGAEKLDKPIAEKIREYIEGGNLVLRTMDTHGDDYMNTREGRHLPVPHCIYGTQGWEAYGETGKAFKEIEKNPHYYSISKTSFAMSPYYVEDWLEWLFRNGIDFNDIDTIEFVGLVSNICVISNLRFSMAVTG